LKLPALYPILVQIAKEIVDLGVINDF